MDTLQRTIFISDLHLAEDSQEQTNTFLSLLNGIDETVDALYILGDLFEYWIGDDIDTSFNRKIKSALKAVTSSMPVYFIWGNRDFLLGQSYFNETGIIHLPDEKRITLYGTPILLMHGDTLCLKDRVYQKSRRYMRNRLLQRLFLMMPFSFRERFAKSIRDKSARYINRTAQEIIDVTQEAVDERMIAHQVLYLVHGHTHQKNIHIFELSGKEAKRIVLDSWHVAGNALVWYANGDYEMKTIPFC